MYFPYINILLVLQQHFTAVNFWPNFNYEMDSSFRLVGKSSHIYGPWKKSDPMFQIPSGTDLPFSPLTPFNISRTYQHIWRTFPSATQGPYLSDVTWLYHQFICISCTTFQNIYHVLPHKTQQMVNKVKNWLHNFTNEFTVTMNAGLFNTKSYLPYTRMFLRLSPIFASMTVCICEPV